MKTAEQNFQLLQEIEEGRELLLMACEQNPQLLKRAEPRVRELFQSPQAVRPVHGSKQRGVSLIELIIFIVIVSVALTGILLVMNQTTSHSADPLLRKQAIAVAESLLEEINLHSASGVESGTSRQDWTEIQSYNGYATTGVQDILGNAIAGLENYSVSVTVAPAALHTVPVADALLIRVAVTTPQGETLEAVGYRANYEN